jgi:hypothetical protein
MLCGLSVESQGFPRAASLRSGIINALSPVTIACFSRQARDSPQQSDFARFWHGGCSSEACGAPQCSGAARFTGIFEREQAGFGRSCALPPDQASPQTGHSRLKMLPLAERFLDLISSPVVKPASRRDE